MTISIIKTGGKQYKVKSGDIIKIEKIAQKDGSVVKFDTLLSADNDNIQIGRPTLKNATEGKILGQTKAKKIHVIKYKAKIRYKRNIGHRQTYTSVQII